MLNLCCFNELELVSSMISQVKKGLLKVPYIYEVCPVKRVAVTVAGEGDQFLVLDLSSIGEPHVSYSSKLMLMAIANKPLPLVMLFIEL